MRPAHSRAVPVERDSDRPSFIRQVVKPRTWLRPSGYSPRGELDERPNVRDPRYSRPPVERPIELPRRTAYWLGAAIVLTFLVMAAALFAR